MNHKKNRPFLKPPIKRVSRLYLFTRTLVKQGAGRFHRYMGIKDIGSLPKGKDPIIFVSNHQNGMMDPLLITSILKPQLHWLTRADVFWNPVFRMVLFALHQMPIYRQRDRLTDLRERNNAIWECCIDRLEIGAVISIFPEGNHNPQKTIRGLKSGLSDLLGRSLTKHESLKRIKVIPLGLDYEDYPGFRRRFRLRMGKPVEWVDLYDTETEKVNFNQLTDRIQSAIREIAVDIRPYEKYDDLLPYVNALRTTEASAKAWTEITRSLEKISMMKDMEEISKAANQLREAGFESPKMRVEAWGVSLLDVRKKKLWAVALRPLSWIANAPTFMQQLYLNYRGDKVKAIEFRSTLKIGAGMVVYPLSWTLTAVVLGGIASRNGLSFFGWSPFFEVFFAYWAFATFGNSFYGWLQGHLHDHKDAIDGERFWNDQKSAALREAWMNYIAVVKKHL